MLALFAAGVVLWSPAASERWISRADLENKPAIELAPALLPSDRAAQIVGGRTERSYSPGYPFGVQFWERHQPDGEKFCRRRSTVFEIGELNGFDSTEAAQPEKLKVQQQSSYDELALDLSGTSGRCSETSGFVRVPNTVWETGTKRALAGLAQLLQANAKGGAAAPSIQCAPEGECKDARQMVAQIPLQGLFIARPTDMSGGTGNTMELVFAEARGGPVVVLELDMRGELPVAGRISQQIPAPF